MNNKLVKEALGWGLVLWFIGYVLGIILFMFVPVTVIGLIITPIGIAITLWVLIKKVKGDSLQYFLIIGVVWTLVAIIFDYLFLVKLFKPEDGYYKLDVYLYYAFTFALPLIVGWMKTNRKDK